MQEYEDEIMRLTATAMYDSKPVYAGIVEGDRLSLETELTHADIDGTKYELARRTGLDISEISDAVASLTGGERDVPSQATALIELSGMAARDILKLTVELANSGYWTSAEGRREARSKNWALSDGSYPIPDKSHLRKAAILAASGHGNVSAAKALIRRRAKELGVSLDSLPGFGSSSESDEDEADRETQRRRPKRQVRARRGQQAASQGSSEGAAGYASAGQGGEGPSGGEMAATGRRMLVRALGGRGYETIALTAGQEHVLGLADDGMSTVDRIAARNPDMVALGNPAPSSFDAPGTVQHMGAHFDFRVNDTGSSRDPSPRSDPDAEVRRYLGMVKESPQSGNVSHRPKTIGQRRLEEIRATARPENPIQDWYKGS